MKRSMCLAIAGVALAACTKDVRYRYFPDEPSCGRPGCVRLDAREKGRGWELAYVEFRDNGEAWSARQTTEAIDLIQQAKRDNGGAAVVLVYVHGWKNNANQAPDGKRKDVEKFKVALNTLAAVVSKEPAEGALPPVVGIYIGWRGGTIDFEPFKTITYWFRRPVARRIGRNGLFETMGRIVDAARPPGDERSKLLLVSHSFGARVLENAVDGIDERTKEDGRLLAWQKSLPATPEHTSALPPVDLVVFVNAATQSSMSEKTIERLRDKKTVFYGPNGSIESCKDDPTGEQRPACRPLPLYIALTSTGDIATRFVMPIANVVIPPAPGPLRIRSAALTSRLRSHDVREVACPAAETEVSLRTAATPTQFRCQPAGSREFCFEATRAERRICYEVHRKPGASNQTPFWAMTVDPRVVADHGDIWNQNLLDLFTAVLVRTQAANVGARRVMQRR